MYGIDTHALAVQHERTISELLVDFGNKLRLESDAGRREKIESILSNLESAHALYVLVVSGFEHGDDLYAVLDNIKKAGEYLRTSLNLKRELERD